ncbi:hypothetical protein CQW23_10089 [Capsicum baccatum]|uniref:Tetratricopeptide repeat protein 33 n=1 Tax=Capsicum baccatum TaxID=33114 RepID=A0A2G2WYN9_CAPBA|nr:hypothetical protein CQW23_10089 [Capsicum baccatum]
MIAWSEMAGSPLFVDTSSDSNILSITACNSLVSACCLRVMAWSEMEGSPLSHDPAACLKSLFLFFLLKEGKYREALGKWESALLLIPDRAILHEQKAQILLELGETWKALKAATRATELEPSWDEAWVTLGRAQLNYGEPDSAIESLDRALAIKPDSTEARNDRQAALHHIQRRKQLQTSGLSMNQNRFAVVDKTESA